MEKAYQILQIPPDASEEQIQRAYRVLALKYHPDRNPDPSAAAKMIAINEAYQTLRRSGRCQMQAGTVAHTANDALAQAILGAARDLVLRSGWKVTHDAGAVILLRLGVESVCLAFLPRVGQKDVSVLLQQHPGDVVVLAAAIEGALHLPLRCAVVDLVRGQKFGSLTTAAARSLLAVFL